MEWIVWILAMGLVIGLYLWLKSPAPVGTRETRQVRKAYKIAVIIIVIFFAGFFWMLISSGCNLGMEPSTDWWCI